MEAALTTLIDEWLGAGQRLAILDEASVAVARTWVRDLGAEHGLPLPVIESLATVISELSHNQLVHARGGEVAVRPIRRDQVPGLEIVAADRGDGIADPTRALHGSPTRSSGARGLGIGLSGARRLSDEMDFDVRWREGTCVWARKFAAPVPRRPEVALLGGPRAGETKSGDHGAFIRLTHSLVVGVADGLGHGDAAREAADRAIAALRGAAGADVLDILLRAEADSEGTRGCVMAVVAISDREDRAGEAVHVGVGDITTQVRGPARVHHFTGLSRVLGQKDRGPRPRRPPFASERAGFSRGEALFMFTDGIKSRAAVPAELLLQRQHALVLAHHLLRDHSRGHDDALVLVVT